MKRRYIGQLTQEAAHRLRVPPSTSLCALVVQEAGPDGLFVISTSRTQRWDQVTPSDFEGGVLIPVRSVLEVLANEP